jgi:hypothetical protein
MGLNSVTQVIVRLPDSIPPAHVPAIRTGAFGLVNGEILYQRVEIAIQ